MKFLQGFYVTKRLNIFYPKSAEVFICFAKFTDPIHDIMDIRRLSGRYPPFGPRVGKYLMDICWISVKSRMGLVKFANHIISENICIY